MDRYCIFDNISRELRGSKNEKGLRNLHTKTKYPLSIDLRAHKNSTLNVNRNKIHFASKHHE